MSLVFWADKVSVTAAHALEIPFERSGQSWNEGPFASVLADWFRFGNGHFGSRSVISSSSSIATSTTGACTIDLEVDVDADIATTTAARVAILFSIDGGFNTGFNWSFSAWSYDLHVGMVVIELNSGANEGE